MKFKEFIKKFTETAKDYIGYFERFKDLTGEEKKQKVDDKMSNFALEILEKAKLNVFVKLVIKNYVIKNIPVITQAIFDLIKANVQGITKA